MKLALSIPDSEARNPIKGGRDRGCKELDRDMKSQPNRLKKSNQGRSDGKCRVERHWINMK